MGVKTITIDIEAYEILSRHKKAGQSFSQVIKTHFGAQPRAAAFRALVRRIEMGTDALDAMDAVVARRADEPARAVSR